MASEGGPSWHSIKVGIFAFLVGCLTTILVSGVSNLRGSEVLGLVLGVAALVLAIVGFVDGKTITSKLDALADSTARHQGRMESFASSVRLLEGQGGGSIVLFGETDLRVQRKAGP